MSGDTVIGEALTARYSALVVTASLLLGLGVVLGARERDRAVRQRAESMRWEDRLALVTALPQDGRFAEARAILNEAHADEQHLDQRITEARSHLDLVERLDGIRLGRDRDPQGTGLDYAESSRRYAEAFRSAGLGQRGAEAPSGFSAMSESQSLSPRTLAAQALGTIDERTRAIVPPIHLATTFERDPDNLYRSGNVYGRPDNETVREAEAVIGSLEGAAATLVYGSGMSAAIALFLSLGPGSNVVASAGL